MPKYSSTIEYNIKTNLDASGLQKLQAQLSTVQNALRNSSKAQQDPMGIKASIDAVQQLKGILNKSFNSKLGILNLGELNAQLRQSTGLVQQLNAAFNKAGASGSAAANNLVARLYKMDTGLKSVSKATDKIVNTIGNTFRWGVIASGFASIMNAVHDAAKYTSELDKSLTNIMMVTGESRENMNEFAKLANEAAQKMGSTTTAMTNATTIFVQQGLDLQTSEKLAEYSVHLANVSGQESAEAADEITAYKNAFKIDVEDVENAISKWAAVANNAAVSVEELSTASQKAASVAQTVGVDMDQFAGHIAAIEATTREAPENIGNGLKTLYSRISDIKLGESLEDGVDLGQFTSALQKVGVEALDASGQLRDAGAIIEDLMARWGDLSRTEQVATATTVAGRFQLARFEALLNSADIYKQAKDVSVAETGTATYDRMQETFRDSMQGRMNALQASVEEIFNNLFTTDSMYPLIEGLNNLVDVFNNLVESVGGGSNALSAFGLIFGQIFNVQIARAINNFAQNRQLASMQRNQVSTIQQQAQNTLNGNGITIGDAQTQLFNKKLAGVGQYASIMSQEEVAAFGKNAQELASAMNIEAGARQKVAEITTTYGNELARLAQESVAVEDGMEAITQVAQKASQNISNFQTEVRELIGVGRIGKQGPTGLAGLQRVAQYQDVAFNLPQNRESAAQHIKQTQDSWNKILASDKKLKLLNSADIEKVNAALKILSATELKGASDAEAFKKAILQLDKAMKQALEGAEEGIGGFRAYSQELQRLSGEAEAAAVQQEHMTNALAGTEERLSKQAAVQSVTNLAMGIGQLGFAIQSFQSLGSIWENQDLDDGEKWLQTITNLGMTIPMVTMAFPMMLDGFKALTLAVSEFSLSKAILNKLNIEGAAAEGAEASARAINVASILAEDGAQGTLNATRLIAIANQTGLTAAEVADIAVKNGWTLSTFAQTVAAEGLTAAIGQLTLAMLASPWAPLVIGMMAIGGALAGVAAAVGASNKKWEEHKKQVDENLEASNNLINSIEKTKEKYDELYDSYNKTGIITDELKQSTEEMAEALGIEGAAAKIARGEFDSLNQEIQNATNSQLAYNSAQAAEKQSVLEKEITPQQIYTGVQDWTTTGENGQLLDNGFQNLSIEDSILSKQKNFHDLQQEIDNTTKKMSELNSAGGFKYNQEELKQEIEDLKELQKQYALTEQEKEWRDLQTQQANNTFAQDLNNGIFDNYTDVSQVQAFLDNQSEIFKEYDAIRKTEGEEAAKNYKDGLLAGLQDDDGITQQLKDSLSQYFKNAQDMSVEELVDQYQRTVNDIHPDVIDALDLKGSEKERQAQLNEIYEQSKAELISRSENLQNESQALQNHTKELEDNLKAERDRVAEITKDNKITSEEQKELSQIAQRTKAWNKELRKANSDLKSYTDMLDDMTVTQINTEEGVKTLVKNFEDWNTALTSSDTTMGDRTKATNELADALSMISGGLDASNFDGKFISENLDLIGEAASGNTDKLRELKVALEQQFLLNLGITDETINLPTTISSMLAEIQSIAANSPINTDITANVQPFVDAMYKMRDAGIITTEQLRAAINSLSGLGVTADITWNEEKIEAEVQSLASAFKDGFAENGLQGIGALASGLNNVVGHIKYPEITYRTNDSNSNSSLGGAAGAGKSGGSKGGGGSKGKEPSKVSRTKEADTEKDIYNKLNAQLEKLQDNYKKIDRLKENAAGAKYRKYINEEIANLEAQNANLAKRNKLTKEYLKALKGNKDRPELNVKKTDTLGFYGLKDKNKDGVVDNYDSVINKARKEAAASQKAADDYFKAHGGTFDAYGNTVNQATMDENESKEYKRLTEKASDQAERVKSITDAANKYQDAWNDVRDTLDQIDENLQSIIDKQVELFDRAVDAAQSLQEVNESAAKLKAFGSKNGFGDWTSSDSPFRAMVEDGELLSGTYDKLIDDSDAFYDDMIKKAKKNKDAASQQFWEDQKKNAKDALGNGTSAIDLAQNQLEFLLSDAGKDKFSAKDEATGRKRFDEAGWLEAVKKQKTIVENAMYRGEELVEKLTDDIINGYKKIDEYMNDHFEKYQQWLDKLEYRNKLIELTYGESNLEAIGDNLEAQSLTLESLIKDENTYYEQLKVEEQKRWEDYKKNGTEKSYELWKEVHDLAEAQSDKIEDLVVQRIEAIQAIAKNNIEKAKRAMDQAFYGTAEDPFVQSWELAKERADAYKDEVEAGYEIDKLRGKFQKLLDNASTLKTQKQIKQVMQEQLDFLNAQVDAENHKVTMSQFDVDLANAKIALLEKQIALEDAQRNKNQMQLRRDSQGNYNYVYTANDDEVNEKEEEVLDAGYDIYEMSKQEVQRINEEAVRMYQDAQNRIAAIQESTVLDATQKKKMVAEILDNLQARFVEMGVDLQDAIQGTIDGASILYKYGADDTKSYYAEMATATKDTWNKAAKDVGICYSDTIHEVLAGNKEFNKSVETMRSTFNTEINNMKGAADTVTEKISKDFEETTESVDDTKEAVKSLTSEMDQLNQAMKDDLGAIDTASTRLQKYTKQLNTTKDSASKLRQDLNDANETIAKLKAENLDYSTRLKNLRAGRAETDNGDKPKGKGEKNKSSGVDEATAYGIAQNIHTYGSWGNDPVRKKRIIERYGEATAKRAQEIVNEVYNRVGGSAYAYELYNPKSEIYGYDTGGYTGAWGSDGKLAMLHEKELVLNQQDTVNMLAAINMVRQIVDAIKTPNFSSSLGNWTSSKSGDTIEQRVEVTAEFPNVTDSGEIEAALISLADNAYQYAHRN